MAEFEFVGDDVADDITPERPRAENVLFFLLGIASMIAVVLHLAGLF